MSGVLAFDPGLSGGWAYIDEDGIVVASRLPLAGGVIDLVALRAVIADFGPRIVCVEEPLALPKMSHHGSLAFGRTVGRLEGIVVGCGVGLVSVRPQTWKAKILAGTKKDKDAAIAYVRNRYPYIELVPKGCRKPHDGMADAICIAEYARSL